MLDNCTNSRETWQAVESLLQGWLKERRELLVKYTAIAATVDLSLPTTSVNAGLERLCQLLVDYVSAGHFEVYYALQREAESFGDVSEDLANGLISRIGDTTEVILGFEEKYPGARLDALDPSEKTDSLESDLSLLGEILETRFELEDQLIAALHGSHAEQRSNR